MKNILIPTDFSSCATHAMEAGFSMARQFGSRLYFLHVIDRFAKGDYLDADESQKAMYQQLFKNTDTLFEKWKKRALAEKIELEASTVIGNFQTELALFVEDKSIDFLIMGSHGVSGKKELFIGSNTQKTVRSLHLPILIVKQSLQKFPFKNVVFASNFDLNERAPFKKFLKVVRPFKPNIHLLHINTSGFFSQPFVMVKEAMHSFRQLAAPLNTEIHFYRDYTVDAGIRHMSESIDADLVGISNYNRHPLKRIFSGSNVEALVNHSELPVLSIDYKGSSEEEVEVDSDKLEKQV